MTPTKKKNHDSSTPVLIDTEIEQIPGEDSKHFLVKMTSDLKRNIIKT